MGKQKATIEQTISKMFGDDVLTSGHSILEKKKSYYPY